MPRMWRGILSVANVQVPATPPGPGEQAPTPRVFEAFTWREPPLTLRAVFTDSGGHEQAAPVSRIDRIWDEGDEVHGEGVFSATQPGVDAETLVDEQILGSVSVDPSDYAYVEEWVDPETQEIVTQDTLDGLIAEAYDAMDNSNEERYVEIFSYLDSLYVRLRFTRYEIGGATLVAIQAINPARIEIVDDAEQVAASAVPLPDLRVLNPTFLRGPSNPVGSPQSAAARLASGFQSRRQARTVQASGPAVRPAGWYRQQVLSEPTPWSITDDGRVIGHLAVWDQCHRSYTGTCVIPPRQSDFTEFHVGGGVALDDGSRMRIGCLTFADLHAAPGGLTAREIQQLMEDTGVQLGTMRLYADEFGIQASGSVHPDVTPEACARALAGYPSGDWRKVAGVYRLFGVHVVNTPGFPVYEFFDGEQQRMVASMTQADPPGRPHTLGMFANVRPHVEASCGCDGACTCDTHLTAAELAELASLDQAQRIRRTLTSKV